MAKPVVNKEECTAYESCVDECPEQAISIKDDLAVIDYEKCTECGSCVETCPVEAITMPE